MYKKNSETHAMYLLGLVYYMVYVYGSIHLLYPNKHRTAVIQLSKDILKCSVTLCFSLSLLYFEMSFFFFGSDL